MFDGRLTGGVKQKRATFRREIRDTPHISRLNWEGSTRDYFQHRSPYYNQQKYQGTGEYFVD
jgi:hypothetical protein